TLVVLTTAAAAWLWAHEGHAPLPTKGAQVDVAKGRLVLSRDAREALDVQTADVVERSVDEKLLAYATLVAPWQQHAYVSTRLAGRIEQLHIRPGQAVTAGQLLAEVQSPELKNLQLELRNARNDVDLSERILKELEPAIQQGAVSGQRLLEAQTKHRQNVNALAVARGKWLGLGLTQESLDQLLRERDSQRVHTLPVLSPIAGVVIHADLAVGKVVEPAEHLFEIVDLATVWVKISVLEKDLPRVAVGQSVKLNLAAYPGEVFHTQIQVKGLYLDPVTHFDTVWAELANSAGHEPRFLPGMSGQAQLLLSAPAKMLAAPTAALIADGAERYV